MYIKDKNYTVKEMLKNISDLIGSLYDICMLATVWLCANVACGVKDYELLTVLAPLGLWGVLGVVWCLGVWMYLRRKKRDNT